MSSAIILRAPSTLTAPLPGTPVLRVSGDIVVLATDPFTGADGTPVAGRLSTAPVGQTPLAWASNVATRLLAGTMIQAETPLTGVTYVTIPADQPPASYEMTFKISTALVGSVYLDLFRDSEAAGAASDKFRLSLDSSAMTMRLSSNKAGVSTAVGTSTPFVVGDTLGLRAHPTKGTLTSLRNGVVVQTYTGQPAQPGRGCGLAYGPSTWGVDDFRLVQVVD